MKRLPRTLVTQEKTSNHFYGSYKKNDIQIDRDKDTNTFYIIVTACDGGYLYDGWYDNSENASIDEAILEAINGAQL